MTNAPGRPSKAYDICKRQKVGCIWSTITSGSVITELVTVETIIPAVAP
ncbi:hypothetical protein FOCG_05149 [Fusarium oxysporum f. sp. radicis-lycopersici 26381]|nr:hypothetical protein FOCG_05149 [Fusarium oxysporum f. sp. radicis-lycopersici 26381]